MKRLVLIIGLVTILVGSLLGGLALHTNAATPTVKVASFGGAVPGTMTVAGQNWTYPGLDIGIYLDAIDNAHAVAGAKVGSNGAFIATFMINSASLGYHTIYAIQTTPVSTVFMVTSRSPTDSVLNDIQTKVNDPAYGLAEIKSEVADIQSQVNNADHGLSEIKEEIQAISNHSVKMEADSNLVHVSEAEASEVFASDINHLGHFSVTLRLYAMEDGDGVYLRALMPYSSNYQNYLIDFWEDAAATGTHTVEFDASDIIILATGSMDILWGYTVIYPEPPVEN
jgi:hypothetical protein